MRKFHCQCGNTLFFENTHCYVCDRTLGYLLEHGLVSALEPLGETVWNALAVAPDGQNQYRMCTHYARDNVCNWMIPLSDPEPFCRACRLNQVIPDLTQPYNPTYWYKIEAAKRRLIYTLHQLNLPLRSRAEDPEHGLAFAFLADTHPEGEFSDAIGNAGGQVLTGHAHGLITINLAEADDIQRARIREQMNERYRTLLGHFRHEIGHYYWDLLIKDSPKLEQFRALFGNERVDYAAAVQQHYANGPPADWNKKFISAYAAAHPWEDWAESFAHYLHMIDTLETANDYGFAIHGISVTAAGASKDSGPQSAADEFDMLLADWIRLTGATNAINRSMGLADAYPFVLCAAAQQKLLFVHEMITTQANTAKPTP